MSAPAGLKVVRNGGPAEAHDGDGALLLTVPQVCSTLAVGRDTVYRLINTGALPSLKIASLRRVRRSDLDSYLAAVTSDSLVREAQPS